jgi:hypothetical protein
MKIIDLRKRGVWGAVLALPIFFLTWLIAPGTFVPFFTFAAFIGTGAFFLLKKERYCFWCPNCSSDTDNIGKSP